MQAPIANPMAVMSMVPLNVLYAPVPLRQLAYYWNLNETGNADRVDSVAGLHWPAAINTMSVPGLYGNAVKLDTGPTEGFLSMDAAPLEALAIQSSTRGVSLWGWFTITGVSSPADVGQCYIQWNYLGSGLRGFLSFNLASASCGAEHEDDNSGDDITSSTLFTQAVDGIWHMFACVFDRGAAALRFYLDGALKNTVADPIPPLTSDNGSMNAINSGIGGVTGPLVWDLDEVGLCLDWALTSAQVTALYAGGAGVTWPGVASIVLLNE